MELCNKVSIMETFECYVNFYFFTIFILWCNVRGSQSVPIDYCLQRLNQNDCKMKPTPVFSYYKPGSRCEIEIWRGCPTFNKFATEVECSHHCIGKLEMIKDLDENNMLLKETHVVDVCQQVLDTAGCTAEEVEVFTFNNGACVKSIWRGCPSYNKFNSKQSCMETCSKYLESSETDPDLKDELNKLSNDKIHQLDDVLNNIIKLKALEESKEPEIQIMLLKITETTTQKTEVTTLLTTAKPSVVTAKPTPDTTTTTTEKETTTLVVNTDPTVLPDIVITT